MLFSFLLGCVRNGIEAKQQLPLYDMPPLNARRGKFSEEPTNR